MLAAIVFSLIAQQQPETVRMAEFHADVVRMNMVDGELGQEQELLCVFQGEIPVNVFGEEDFSSLTKKSSMIDECETKIRQTSDGEPIDVRIMPYGTISYTRGENRPTSRKNFLASFTVYSLSDAGARIEREPVIMSAGGKPSIDFLTMSQFSMPPAGNGDFLVFAVHFHDGDDESTQDDPAVFFEKLGMKQVAELWMSLR